jgi:hypothetical protein
MSLHLENCIFPSITNQSQYCLSAYHTAFAQNTQCYGSRPFWFESPTFHFDIALDPYPTVCRYRCWRRISYLYRPWSCLKGVVRSTSENGAFTKREFSDLDPDPDPQLCWHKLPVLWFRIRKDLSFRLEPDSLFGSGSSTSGSTVYVMDLHMSIKFLSYHWASYRTCFFPSN